MDFYSSINAEKLKNTKFNFFFRSFFQKLLQYGGHRCLCDYKQHQELSQLIITCIAFEVIIIVISVFAVCKLLQMSSFFISVLFNVLYLKSKRFNSIGNNGCTLFLSLLMSLDQLRFFYLDVRYVL